MSTYTPDRWVMLEIKSPGDTVRKILGGWYGGYTQGDSWKLSSGNTEVLDRGEYFEIPQYSGSTYKCYKEAYGFSSYMHSVFNSMAKQVEETPDVTITVIKPEDIV